MPLPEEFNTDQFRKGLAIRREVLGATYVDKSVDEVEDFMKPMQKMTTEWCWGEIWSRPLLERKTRSMLNLAMLTALNRPHEVRLHVRGALNNGVSVAEIQEVLLQACIYCGVPAALDSFRIAHEVIKEGRRERERAQCQRTQVPFDPSVDDAQAGQGGRAEDHQHCVEPADQPLRGEDGCDVRGKQVVREDPQHYDQQHGTHSGQAQHAASSGATFSA